jgi:hypothetical protein
MKKMKTRNSIFHTLLGLIGAALVFAPNRAIAQAAPGPLPPPSLQSRSQGSRVQPATKPKPEISPRMSLAGAWKLNRDESDDARQKVRAAESADIGSYPGGAPGGGYPGGYPRRGPWGGGSPYPGGGGPNSAPRNSGQNIEENPKIQSLIHPAESLVVDLKNPEIDFTDNQFRKLLLYTDGRQLQKTSAENHERAAAHWSGSDLVSDEKSPLGGKMNRTFELSQDGRQLYETLHIDNGRAGAPLIIRYVYDAATNLEIKNTEDSDPNRPMLKWHPDGTSDPSQ